MVLVVFGAPGVGKGSQATVLSKTLHIPHISTGDIFRENVSNETDLGRIVKVYMDQGSLVPDEITINLIMDRIRKGDCINGFILDGFPRTLSQAEHLDDVLKKEAWSIDAIINICLADDKIIARLTGRRVCPSCNLVYHLLHRKPDRAGKCNHCKTMLVQRDDDTEATIRKRLQVYHTKTKALLAYYRKTHTLFDIESREDISDTTSQIFDALDIEPERSDATGRPDGK